MKGLIAVMLALALLPVTAQSAPARSAMLGEAVALTEWRKAENRRACAPLAFATTRSGGGQPRHAYFGGGWGVAFDRAELRSAFGVAGAGLLPGDGDGIDSQRRELVRAWPYVRVLPRLQRQALAGYGIEGAKPLTAADGDGRGLNLLAYVRVPGQRCLYNVWSKLGRTHLELLLDSMRVVEVRR